MTETPDFEQLARTILYGVDAKAIRAVTEDESAQVIAVVGRVEAQLRFLWNARGAADLAAIDEKFKNADLSIDVLNQTIRALDR